MTFLSRTWTATLALLLPFVCAGAVETQLVVTATDDGLPSGSTLSYTWTVTSFPAAATGPNAAQILATPSAGIPGANAQNPRVVLSIAGTYVFHVAVSDGQLTTQGNSTQDVTIVVNPVPNTPPTISDMGDLRIAKGTVAGPINFTINDGGSANGLTLAFSSSNTALVPNANGVFAGTGTARTLTVTPVSGLSGTTTITVTVTDSGALKASDTFVLTVNAPPVITSVSATKTTLTLP